MTSPYLSVIIPSFNEAKNFKRGVLNNVFNYLKRATFSWEVILVDDGSTDQTSSLLLNFVKNRKGFRLVRIKHGGKFKAVSRGVEEVKGEVCLFSDFDQSTSIEEFEKVKKALDRGADVVIGDRTKGKRIGDPLFRYIRSRLFNFLVQILVLPGIADTQCGFKAFKVKVAKNLFSSLLVSRQSHVKGGFMGGFDVELLYLARKKGYQIETVPVKWTYAESGRLSFWEPVQMFLDILKIRLFDISGKYPNEKN